MKKNKTKQLDLFQESNVMSLDEWKKTEKVTEEPKQERILHEKKFMKSIEKVLKDLGLVYVHFKNRCLNKFYHTCPHCQKRSLVTCHAHINKMIDGWPDLLVIAGAIELKHRSYGIKTAKLRKGLQEDVCDTLAKKIPIKVINEESQEELLGFLKDMCEKIQGRKI